MIARQQQMIAVVDHHVERGIVIGAAAAAGLMGRLMHDDAVAALREPHGSGEAGEPGADDVDDGERHQITA